eukprot:6472330-Amphidinium_carterae.1
MDALEAAAREGKRARHLSPEEQAVNDHRKAAERLYGQDVKRAKSIIDANPICAPGVLRHLSSLGFNETPQGGGVKSLQKAARERTKEAHAAKKSAAKQVLAESGGDQVPTRYNVLSALSFSLLAERCLPSIDRLVLSAANVKKMCEEAGLSCSEDKQAECLRLLEYVTGIVPSQMKLWKSNGMNVWTSVITFLKAEAESRGRVQRVMLPMEWEKHGVYTIVECDEDKLDFHVQQQVTGEKILITEEMWMGAAAMASQLRLETNWSETGSTLELTEDVEIDNFKSLKIGVLFRQHVAKRTLAVCDEKTQPVNEE